MGELEPGTVFAGHRIETVAGRGGMGVVYRATQLALDRTVALKVIAAGLLEDQTVRNRFVRESKVAASIDHPNVIPIYYAGEEDGIAYIAMRYVAGDDVRSLVRREGPLDPERAARIVAQIGSALDAAHAAGLVHRDIKPANVLLGRRGPRLPDRLRAHQARALAWPAPRSPATGSGRSTTSRPSRSAASAWTPAPTSTRSAACSYYTLTGEVPFKREGDEARLWAHLPEPPPKPSEHARAAGRVRRRDRARAREGPRGALPVGRRPRPRRHAAAAANERPQRARAARGQGRRRAGRIADRHRRHEPAATAAPQPRS